MWNKYTTNDEKPVHFQNRPIQNIFTAHHYILNQNSIVKTINTGEERKPEEDNTNVNVSNLLMDGARKCE